MISNDTNGDRYAQPLMDTSLFAPGTRLKLLAMPWTRSKISASLIGHIEKQYLIVERPLQNGLPAHLPLSSGWSATILHRGEIICFQTTVLHSFAHPFPISFLSYPDQVERTGLRRHKRLPVHLTCSCQLKHDARDLVARGVIDDLSEGGCCFKSEMPLPLQQMVFLQIALPRERNIHDLAANTKRCEQWGRQFVTGMEFSREITGAAYRELLTYIDMLRGLSIRA